MIVSNIESVLVVGGAVREVATVGDSVVVAVAVRFAGDAQVGSVGQTD